MADLARIKNNVAKMVAQNAPESDIDGYIASEGVTIEDVRNYKPEKDYTLGRLGTIDRGATFGLGRKLGGLVNAIGAYPVDRVVQGLGVKNTPGFWDRYHEIVDPTMEAIEEYHKDKPLEALSLELGSSVVNPANRLGVGYIKNGTSLANTAMRSGAVGSAIGGVAGGLNTEKIEKLPENILAGTGMGAAFGTAMPFVTNKAGNIYNAIKAITLPEASVAGKASGLGNVIKDNGSVRSLTRGIMADDDVAAQVLKESPTLKGALNEELENALDKAVGRKLNIERSLDNQKERFDNFIGRNADYPVYNSLSPEQQAQQNFNRWFEGSQVVDEKGQPVDLWHATDTDFDAFDINKAQTPVIWFAKDKSLLESGNISTNAKKGNSVYKNVYLNMKNPANSKQYENFTIQQLKDRGYDGFVLKKSEGYGDDIYGVFNPNQIKSVNNSGAWSSSPSLSDAGWRPQAGLEQFTQGLNDFQKRTLNEVIAEGVEHSTNERGSLGAMHRALMALNKRIDNTINENPLRPRGKDDPDVMELMQVKDRLRQILEPSGIRDFDKSLSKAKSLRSFKEMGYKFKPSEVKFENLGLKTLRDKKAFLQGRMQKILDNVKDDKNLAKAIRDDENTLRKLMPKKRFDELIDTTSRIDREYKRINKLENLASRELDKPMAIDRPMSEKAETLKSYLGSRLDKLNAALWTNANRRRGLALLNGGATNPRWVDFIETYSRRYNPNYITPYVSESMAQNQ